MVRDMQTKELLFVSVLMFDISADGVGPSSTVFRLVDSAAQLHGGASYNV
jgi:hypothetical protein